MMEGVRFKSISSTSESGVMWSAWLKVNSHLLQIFPTISLTLWHPAAFGDFREKKHQNACGFAWEFFCCKRYRPGQKLNRRGKSSSLHSKKNFLVGGCGFFVSDVISGGLLHHLGPLHLALGSNSSMAVFRLSFYWKLGYNPSLLILWMTCWGFRFKSYDLK